MLPGSFSGVVAPVSAFAAGGCGRRRVRSQAVPSSRLVVSGWFQSFVLFDGVSVWCQLVAVVVVGQGWFGMWVG